MNMIAILLGMSLDVGGVGGLLSGIFAKSFKRAMLWSAGFGALNVMLLFLVSPTSRFTPIFIAIALFWGTVGWFSVGRFFARRRAAKASSALSLTYLTGSLGFDRAYPRRGVPG